MIVGGRIAQIRELVSAGKSPSTIAKRLGKTKRYVENVIAAHNLVPAPPKSGTRRVEARPAAGGVERSDMLARRIDTQHEGGWYRGGKWQPGLERVAPAFTTASLYTPDGKPIEYHPAPLASLGEEGAVEMSREPVVPGPKRKSPSARRPRRAA